MTDPLPNVHVRAEVLAVLEVELILAAFLGRNRRDVSVLRRIQ